MDEVVEAVGRAIVGCDVRFPVSKFGVLRCACQGGPLNLLRLFVLPDLGQLPACFVELGIGMAGCPYVPSSCVVDPDVGCRSREHVLMEELSLVV